MATKNELATAVQAKDMTEIRRCLADTPALLNESYNSNGAADVSLLSLAVETGFLDLAQELINVHGVDPNAADADGNTALHAVANCSKHSTNPALNVDPADVMAFLLANGADLTQFNNSGQSAVHLAAQHGRIACLDQLTADPGFDAANVADARGWTPMEMAGGAGQSEVEDYLIRNGKAVDAPLIAPGHPAGLTTIDVLCMATKIAPKIEPTEDFATALAREEAKVRDFYTNLYKRPEFRKTLDLAAQDAVGGRSPTPGPQAMRLYFDFNTDAAGSISTKGGYGAFDPDANTLVLGGERDLVELEGTIIHEMTHHAAQMIYGNTAVPFAAEGDATSTAYLAAIADDVKISHHCLGGETRKVVDTVTTRIGGYTARGGSIDKKRDAAMQEFIVGIPQAIHEHGEAAVAAASPNMLAHYKTQFNTDAAGVPDPNNLFGTVIDGNAAFIATLAPLPPDPVPPAEWVPNTHTSTRSPDRLNSRAGMTAFILAEYRATKSVSVGDSGTGLIPAGSGLAPLAHSVEAFRVPEDADGSYYTLSRTIGLAIEPLLAELPPELSEARLVGLAQTAAAKCGTDPDPTVVAKAIAKDTRDAIREAKFEFAQHRQAAGAPDDELKAVLSDAIVFDAACQVLDATGRDSSAPPQMSGSELRKLRSKVERKLEQSGKIGAVAMAPNKAKQMSVTLANSDAVKASAPGFFAAPIPLDEQKKIKLNTSKAKSIWVAQLAGF